MADEACKDECEDEEEVPLCLFGRNINVDIYYACQDCRLLSGKDYIVKGNIIQLARVDIWMVTVVTYLVRIDQNVYLDTFSSHVG